MLKEQCSEKEFFFLLPRGERWDGANSHQKLAGVLPRFRLAARLPRLQRGKRFFRPLAKKHIVAGPLAVSCRLPTAVRPSVVPPFPYICTANMATQS